MTKRSKMESKGLPDEVLPVIEGARLTKLRQQCSALSETLQAIWSDSLREIGDGRLEKVRYRGDTYTCSVTVRLRTKGDKWQGSTDDEEWTDLQPTRDAAIKAALKAELTQLLENLDQA